jgi:hypothetical protein
MRPGEGERLARTRAGQARCGRADPGAPQELASAETTPSFLGRRYIVLGHVVPLSFEGRVNGMHRP